MRVACSDIFLRPEDRAQQQRQQQGGGGAGEQSAVLSSLRSEDACMHLTHAFVYYDLKNHKDALAFLRKALECDKRSSAAYRLWGE